jgi:ATP-dependent RNA helicase DeaD
MVIITKSEQRKIKAIEKIIKKSFTRKALPDGDEICRVQLLSLAHKIHDTEINHDIDQYLGELQELYANTSKEELIKKIFSVEFTRFRNYYKDAKDLNASANSGEVSANEQSIRYFINVGKKDGYDWMSLKDFLRAVLELGKDDVFKVEVKDSFSFFNTDEKQVTKVLEFFQDFKYNGRYVNVEISENPGGSKRKSKRSGWSSRSDSGNGKGRRSKSLSKDPDDREDAEQLLCHIILLILGQIRFL